MLRRRFSALALLPNICRRSDACVKAQAQGPQAGLHDAVDPVELCQLDVALRSLYPACNTLPLSYTLRSVSAETLAKGIPT